VKIIWLFVKDFIDEIRSENLRRIAFCVVFVRFPFDKVTVPSGSCEEIKNCGRDDCRLGFSEWLRREVERAYGRFSEIYWQWLFYNFRKP
jgi:hypothetical protein